MHVNKRSVPYKPHLSFHLKDLCMYLSENKRIFQVFFKEMVSMLLVVNSGEFKSANWLPQPHSQLEFDIYIMRKKKILQKEKPKWQVIFLRERDSYIQGAMHILLYFPNRLT